MLPALPLQLAELLESLGLAAPSKIRRASRRVRRLARQLPQFESLWLDALANCGALTRWQATEIGAGRGGQLKLGSYVLAEPLADCLYAQAFRARCVESGEQVRLIVAERSGRAARETAGRLRELVDAATTHFGGKGAGTRFPERPGAGSAEKSLVTLSSHEYCALPIAAGQVQQDSNPSEVASTRPTAVLRLWIAAPWIPGQSAADWLICHGRMPATAVLQIARAMASGFADLEKAGLCHGDIAATSVWLADDGLVVLNLPGVRGVLRPEEGYSRADLPPEAFDYLAPERVARGTAPNTASDLFACGCVWWHLLCGRAPLGGGDSLAKLRAAHEARISDPRELAPDTPEALAGAIVACTRPDPERRPGSAAELVTLLGAPSPESRRTLNRSLRAAERPGSGWPAMRAPVAPRGRRPVSHAVAMGLALAAALLVAAWPVWRAVREKAPDASAARQAGAPDRSTRAAAGVQKPSPAVAMDSAQNAVLPAAYVAEAADVKRIGDSADDFSDVTQQGSQPNDLATPSAYPHERILDSGEWPDSRRLDLRPGQRVRAPDGTRAKVRVPSTGLKIAVEDAGTNHDEPVQFENIDFIWDHAVSGDGAMTVVEAGNVRFRSCTFRSHAPGATPPAAVRWVQPPPSQAGAMALPSGSIRFTDCLFQDVAVALDSGGRGALRVEFVNVLHLGPGPLLQSPHWPRADESMNLVLQQVTLRGAASLWQCRVEESASAPGRVFIRAERSVFAPAGAGALLLFRGDGDPTTKLQNLNWEGEGALVTPGARFAAWNRPGGMTEWLDDADVPIAGLVLSGVEFAGPADEGSASSQLLRWNAPLRTADPPGCNPARLPPTTSP